MPLFFTVRVVKHWSRLLTEVGDVQNPTGHSPLQPAAADPA